MKGGNKDTTFFYFTLIEDEDQKKKQFKSHYQDRIKRKKRISWINLTNWDLEVEDI